MKSLVKVIVMLASLFGTWYVGQLILDRQLTTIIVGSILLHEIGHYVPFRFYGQKAWMVFLVIVAVVHSEKTTKPLNYRQESIVTLLGPAMNLVLVGVGLALNTYTRHDTIGLTIAGINASLALFNLLPFSILDGGQYIKLFFESLDEKSEKVALRAAMTIATAVILILAALGSFSFYGVALIFGLRSASKKDNPEGWRKEAAMNKDVAWASLAIYLAMFLGALVAVALLPSWGEVWRQR